jgi:hypothetical protein
MRGSLPSIRGFVARAADRSRVISASRTAVHFMAATCAHASRRYDFMAEYAGRELSAALIFAFSRSSCKTDAKCYVHSDVPIRNFQIRATCGL